jgi:hypothetical protein
VIAPHNYLIPEPWLFYYCDEGIKYPRQI